MTLYSAASAAPPHPLHRPAAALLGSARLPASRSPWLAPLRHLPARSRRLAAQPHQPVVPHVQAKKQTYLSFDELLEKSDKPVLVDFYATWCGPCQFMFPVLEEVGEKLKDKIQVVKIDTEKDTNIADRYKIEALPTFIIFRDGKPCDRFEGAMPANMLIQRIESALNTVP